MRVKIRKMDHSGDSVMATYDTDVDNSVTVAQSELEAFLADCVAKHGECPPVWAKRAGSTSFSPVKVEVGITPKIAEDLRNFEEMLLQFPLVAG